MTPFQYIAGMTEIKTRMPSFDDLTGESASLPAPGHDEWFRDRVQKALKAKQEGKAHYKDLRAVAAKFGFNAR